MNIIAPFKTKVIHNAVDKAVDIGVGRLELNQAAEAVLTRATLCTGYGQPHKRGLYHIDKIAPFYYTIPIL